VVATRSHCNDVGWLELQTGCWKRFDDPEKQSYPWFIWSFVGIKTTTLSHPPPAPTSRTPHRREASSTAPATKWNQIQKAIFSKSWHSDVVGDIESIA
jgi:hypothetical protein